MSTFSKGTTFATTSYDASTGASATVTVYTVPSNRYAVVRLDTIDAGGTFKIKRSGGGVVGSTISGPFTSNMTDEAGKVYTIGPGYYVECFNTVYRMWITEFTQS